MGSCNVEGYVCELHKYWLKQKQVLLRNGILELHCRQHALQASISNQHYHMSSYTHNSQCTTTNFYSFTQDFPIS